MERGGRANKRPHHGGGGAGRGGRAQRARLGYGGSDSSEASRAHHFGSPASGWAMAPPPFHAMAHPTPPAMPPYPHPAPPYTANPYGIYTPHFQPPTMPYGSFASPEPAPYHVSSPFPYLHEEPKMISEGGTCSPGLQDATITAMPASDPTAQVEIAPGLDKAAMAAYQELLELENGVTVWKVVKAMLLSLKCSSLDSLGVQLHEVPCLRKLSLLEGKVNAFIHCHVAVKRITTLYELSKDICQHEGVSEFNELGLGPLIHHSLVVQYFAPPVLADIYRITTDEVIQHLSDYLDKVQQDTVRVEDLLDFMTTERNLSSPKHLCVRIQSLGMYVSFLCRGKKAEKMFASRQASLARSREMAAEEAEPSIIKRVTEFLTNSKDVSAQASQHAYLRSDEDDKEGEGGLSKRLRQESFTRISSSNCPYPSAAEERTRLESIAYPLSMSDVALSETELQDFIASWKDFCKEQAVLEVLVKMLHSSWSKKKWNLKKKKKQAKLFQDYPAIGLLNVAVMSMKAGHWDSLYDAFQDTTTMDQQSLKDAISEDPQDVVDAAATNMVKLSTTQQELAGHVLEHLRKLNINTWAENSSSINFYTKGSTSWKWFTILMKILEWEKLLPQAFSSRDFPSLGLGEFQEFVEKHWETILQFFPDNIRKSDFDLCHYFALPLHRFQTFVSQIMFAIDNDMDFLKASLLQLMYKQFSKHCLAYPICDNVDDLLKSMMDDKTLDNAQNTIHFSFALLSGSQLCGRSQRNLDFKGKESLELPAACTVGTLGYVSSSEALRCLLNAPMLYDLSCWSQWDSIFAPSLGPLIDWLEGHGASAGLQCMVTSDGIIMKIDGSATIDDFLVASVEGCARNAAVKLVSLVAVYGGVSHAPQALLKLHASKAMEILLNSAIDAHSCDGSLNGIFDAAEGVKMATNYQSEAGSFADVNGANIIASKNGPRQNFDQCAQKAVSFVLACICHVPLEFCTFTASILIPALSSVIPDAAAGLLSACSTVKHRSVLHEVGVALGIQDFIDDYRSLFSTPVVSLSLDSSKSMKLSSQGMVNAALKDDGNCLVAGQNHGKNIDADDLHMPLPGSQLEDAEITNRDPCADESAIRPAYTIFNDTQNGSLVRYNANLEYIHGNPIKENEDLNNSTTMELEASELIMSIRREEFGLDVELQFKEYCLLEKQHARIGRALQCLSRDIYSQDSHFVLELVQNADDNNYADEVEASLVFVLQRDRIVIFNNELGFSAANMRALCDIGNSTKAGSSAGYIGHKGIGFKSVFRITDSPEIHSGGFHVKFDTSEGNLGFILPTIIPPVPDIVSFSEVLSAVEKMTYPGNYGWNTCMVLPLKPSFVDGTDHASLGKKFNDIHTSLLLFLHRLRCIAIKNDLCGSLRFMRRRDLQDGLVTVLHNEGEATWLVVKRHLGAAVFRAGVQSTEIAIAFPLQKHSCGDYEALCEQQEVFAFLPLRSYGLKFIVQGDFVLPTSREEVDCDSAWNQWLLSEIPGVFIKAVDSFKALPMFKQYPGKAATALTSFIPLDGEVQGFFSSLPRMILSGVRGCACLPVDKDNIEWVLPCMVLGGWNYFSRMLLSDTILMEHLGLKYLHRDVTINPVLASSLGVHIYGTQTLVCVMESLCGKKGALNSLGPCWIGSWLVAIYKCLSSNIQETSFFTQDRKGADLIKELQCLPFIPLSNGSHTSVKEGPIWLPGGSVDSNCELKNFPLLYTELRIIHPLVLHPLFTENENPEVKSEDAATLVEFSNLIRNMLQRIGIGEICAHEVVNAHIFPLLASDKCLEKEPGLVLQYLAFVKLHLFSDCARCKAERSNILMHLRKIAIVSTNNGFKRTENEFLHFGAEFGCPVKVSKILCATGLPWNEVDVAYLKVCQNEPEPDELSNWRLLFKELGITDFVKVVQVDKKISNKLVSSWKDISWEDDVITDWAVRDWECPELVKIMERLCKHETEMQKFDICCELLCALDVLWENYYSKFCATYRSVTGTGEERETEPSFVLQMRKFAWIKSSLDGKLHYPADLFHRCSTVEMILGNNAPYAMPQIQNNNLVTALGLHTDVSERHVLELLKIWGQQISPFKASMEQMTRLYTLLWGKLDCCRDDVLEFFKSQCCIFVPSRQNTSPEQILPGFFLPVRQVCWSDKTGCVNMLLKLRSANCEMSDFMPFMELSTLYPTLHGFFVTECGVYEMLELEQHLSILKLLTKDFCPNQIGKQVMEILINWFEEIDVEQLHDSQASEWKALLEDVDNKVLPTLQNQWVSANKSDGLLCWCDNEDIGKEFADSGKVYYLQIDATMMNAKSSKRQNALLFLHNMAIPRLSEVVQREPIVYGAQNSEQLLNLLKWTLPYVQRYLRQWHLQHYYQLQEGPFVNHIKQFHCILADKLYFRYTLPGGIFSGRKRTECDCLLQGNTLYVTQLDNLNLLYLEFSRLFFVGQSDTQLANFLHLITLSAQSAVEETEVQALINAQGISHLPDGELIWTIEPIERKEQDSDKSRNKFLSKETLRKKHNRKLIDNVWPPRHWRASHAFKSITENKWENMKIIDMQLHSKAHRETCNSKVGSSSAEHDKLAFWGDVTVHNEDQSGHGKEISKNTVFSLRGTEEQLSGSIISDYEQLKAPGNMQSESDHAVSGSVSFRDREQLVVGQQSEQQQESTGRLGELIVFKYLIKQHGADNVKWLNQNTESGSSYDLVVDTGDGRCILIEVKSTLSEDKDWFEISQREWDVAVKEGERFMIIRVLLSSSLDNAKLLWLPNPAQLCQDRIIKLALIIPTGYDIKSKS